MTIPRIPSSAMPSISARSSLWSMSFWIATGRTRSSTKERTVSWISRCSSLSSKSTVASLCTSTDRAQVPERARPPGADQHGEEERAGDRKGPGREPVHAHDQHLGRERTEEGDAEERVDGDPRIVGLEAQLEHAVVGDGDGRQEREAPRPAVDDVHVARPRPREPAEDPGGGQELRDAERGGGEREPRLQMQGVAEEEAEPRPGVGARLDDQLAGDDSQRLRDDEAREQRDEQVPERALLRRDGRGGCRHADD